MRIPKLTRKTSNLCAQCCLRIWNHSFSNYIAEALSFLTHGWCVHEKVYKLRNGPHPDDPTRNSVFNDGRIGLRKISLRPQSTLHRWLLDDESGEVRGIEQFTQPKGIVTIPIEKCTYFRTTGLERRAGGAIYASRCVSLVVLLTAPGAN